MNTDHPAYFNVAQLLKEPIGATRAYDVETSLEFQEDDLTLAGPLTGHVSMLRTTKGILVQGTLAGQVVVPCSRCLTDVTVPVTLDVEEEYQPTIDVVRGTYLPVEEEDEALLIDEHHILDMTEVIRQALLLEVPMHALCRDDCAGLCPTCGKDLNAGPCDCDPVETDARWDDLSALLDDVEI